jgi:histidinol-phosphate/aromatic aminotransferase/cobyric acid decarboxylase-like protein
MKANGFPTGFRVSIGTREENERFIHALKQIS